VQPLRLEMFSICSKLNCWHCLQGNILKMVDNITSSILKSETFLFYFCVHLSGGSGVPIFRADAECPSGGLAVASFIA
jgi:hypothetical protein